VTYFTLQVPGGHRRTACARLEEGQFIVEAGSYAREKWMSTQPGRYQDLFRSLIDKSILIPNDTHCKFAKSYAFSSPSAAASVVVGHYASGRNSWMLKGESKSYADWEKEQLTHITGETE